ncbi:helix-turn-helix domain-containing protein [Aeromonas allosaccharophila]|uniref:helix-turn-helix domain-containing protein n=1 Tax=Aeromonas allosaccharophila TaxID=656 RepID=UPI0035B95F55
MNKKKTTPKNGTTLFEPPENTTLHSGPTVNRRQAKILNLLRQGPMSSLAFTYEHKLTRAAARIFELRQKGFNITTHIKLDVQYRGDLYPKAATYVLEHPEWSAPSQSDSNATTS